MRLKRTVPRGTTLSLRFQSQKESEFSVSVRFSLLRGISYNLQRIQHMRIKWKQKGRLKDKEKLQRSCSLKNKKNNSQSRSSFTAQFNYASLSFRIFSTLFVYIFLSILSFSLQSAIIIFDSKMEQVSSLNPSSNSRPRRTIFHQPLAFQAQTAAVAVAHIPAINRTQGEIQLLIEFIYLLRQQLPTMQQSFLFATLFSSHHESLILTHQSKACAGLTFCQMYGRRMIELTLMASKQHRKGFGSILVNYLKSLAQLRRIPIIFTHADNSAIAFYQKMGFSTRQIVERRDLGDRVFSNSTVMSCKIDGKIDYFALRDFLKRQREWVAEQMRCSQPFFEISAQKEPILMGANFFRIDPSELQIEGFAEQYEQLINYKHHKTYREFFVHLNRLIAIAHPEVVTMRGELKSLPFVDYAEPIELYSVRQNALNGKYETKQQMVEEVHKLIRNCRRLYASQANIMANLKAIEQELQLIKQQL